MKKLILILSLFMLGCSKPDVQTNSSTNTEQEVFTNKNYNNLVFLDVTYEKVNSEGNQLPVNIGDAVTIFEKTTNIKITASTFETNLIAPIPYFKNGNTYSFAPQTQFSIYENSKIIVKKIEYPTSYGKDKRIERYSY